MELASSSAGGDYGATEDESKKHETILCPEETKGMKINKHGKVKVPRRLIHCSDGVLEEYSTDEEDEEPLLPLVDTSKLRWLPYLWYMSTTAAYKGLAVCDYFGEKLAYLFGITSPKYEYILEEMERKREEDEAEAQLEKEEREAEQKIISQAIGPLASTYGSSASEQPAVLAVESENAAFVSD